MLAQAQAAFLTRQAETDAHLDHADIRFARIEARFVELTAQIAETDRRNTERFARIEALLTEHHHALETLTEAIRGKIGFKPV
jgi:hypothetical protein